jgi:hypothetical protein
MTGKDIFTFIIFGWFLVVAYGYFKPHLKTKNKMREVDSLIVIIHKQDSIIKTWENHAIRMKRIVGADDSIENWSYKEKVINPIKFK